MYKNKKTLFLIIIFTPISLVLSLLYIYLTVPSRLKDNNYSKTASQIAQICSNKNKGNCYESEFKQLTRNNGLSFAEQTLYALWDFDSSMRRCHVIAHVIAKEATRQNPDKWEQFLETVNYTTCSAGFLHGVLESHIGDDPNFIFNSDFINQLCLKGDFYKKQNCVHYMGHLLMIKSYGDIAPALDGCEGIGEELYKRCYTGVFMEDSFPLALVEHQIRPELPNRHDPAFVAKQEDLCRRYNGDRSVACWTGMGENFGVFHDDPRKVYDSCNRAPLELARRECFLKTAGLFAIHPQYSTDEKLVSICQPAENSEDLYKKCIGRMIASLLYYSPKFTERALLLCPKIEQWYREGCFELLKKQIATVSTQSGSKQSQFCQGLAPEHKDLCLN